MDKPPRLTDITALRRNRKNRLNPKALFLHEEAAFEIQERLNEVNRAFKTPAIIAPFSNIWSDSFPGAKIIADDDTLSLKQGDHDLVIHAMSLHWSNDPVGQLIQCKRALTPDGLFIAIFPGGQTLNELRSVLATAEIGVSSGLSPRIAPMSEIRSIGALLQRAGFALPVADSISLHTSYATAWDLMRELRAMGEGNALAARKKTASRRQMFNEAAMLYEQEYSDDTGRIPATFELICLTGWAPHDSQPQPLRPGSAKARLADALSTVETKAGDLSKPSSH
ncbi:methyltransferase domain-containing protein [Parasulfitobacter algicola]|uniref:Methyltransferase domain-containing protein n=1 Tax=Parasulfitobacter algicola TaxID=2614809 RepID=A0ABX2IT50_9RHOB|nr:methyltransferase domain-containing protein [Sulfitobacter algicola]NSX53529.1 methyltransferase domain-containing protein [Sulfitobacter algicola]